MLYNSNKSYYISSNNTLCLYNWIKVEISLNIDDVMQEQKQSINFDDYHNIKELIKGLKMAQYKSIYVLLDK